MIAAALASVWLSLAFVLLMFVVATITSTGRIRHAPRAAAVGRRWPSPAGIVPVLALIFASGVVPFNGPGHHPDRRHRVGNMMTAATLTGRRAFDELSGHFGTYEAGPGDRPHQP